MSSFGVYDEVDMPGNGHVIDKIDSPSLKKLNGSKCHPENGGPIHNRNGNKNGKDVIDDPNEEEHDTVKDSDSVFLFNEQYDTLDETDYPHPDPGANPDSMIKRNLEDLDLTDFPLMKSNKSKVKSVSRLRKKIEGIHMAHTTYFPLKRDESHHLFSPQYVNVGTTHYYDMRYFPRGIIIVFNMEHYLPETGMADFPRRGTERDADGICALFLELGFIVERVDNPTVKMVDSVMDKVAGEGHAVGCVACVVLTHGEEEILYTCDGSVKIKDLTKKWRKKSLAGKPKVFFFQACRGSDYMDSVEAVDGPPEENDLALPCEADFFFAYSTVPGYYSWRNSRNGSWFMQAMCDVFRQYGHHMDLYRLLTHVNDKVSFRKSRTDDPSTDDKRQVASLVSQFRKELFFFPPYGPLRENSHGLL